MRVRREELVVGLAGAAFGGFLSLIDGNPASAARAAVLGAALGSARRYPYPTLAVVLATLLATVSEPTTFASMLLCGAHAFSVGRSTGGWTGIAGLAALIGVQEVTAGLAHDNAYVPIAFVNGAGWGVGRALRERELVAAQLAERVSDLEEEREAHAVLSVRFERARIASELHDIVAHAISVMVVQASAGQRLAAHDPAATAETFDAIAGAAREAEADMGRLVALLGDETAIAPAPDLALVEELVARAASSGLDVRLRLEGEREGLPAPVVEVAYRVVQEGVTNALRYAAGAAVCVTVRGDRDALLAEVRNDRPAGGETTLEGTGTGNGLRGLRERVGGLGGAVEARPTGDGGWLLSARLPRRATAAG